MATDHRTTSMTLTDWIHSIVEGAADSATADASDDPALLMQDIEHELITTTGYNLAGIPLHKDRQ